MDKKEKLEMLQKLSEAELTKKFLIPLFESEGMGFKNVRYTHRRLEFGKDIIYYKDDEFGRRRYTGVQVKKIRITTSETDGIFRQTNEAFGEPFTDLSDNKKKELDDFVVLTSNEFLEDAKDSFCAALRGGRLDRLVSCIDGSQLILLLEKHLPSAFWDEYDYFNKYFNAMRDDFAKVKDINAIGQKESIPLEEIYVSLKLSEERKEDKIAIEREWEIFREETGEKKKERPAERTRVMDAERAIGNYDRLVIVGAPESGKTTLLKHLALKSCKENLEKQERVCVPIPITLRELAESGKSLREYIDKVFEKYEFPKAKDFIEKDLKEGKCRLLLDGFDELATEKNQERIAEEIEKFGKKYGRSQIVATSRIAGYHDELKGFTKLELMEFDDKQIGKFIENWFGGKEPEKARSMFEAVRKNEKIKAIARNPLMIAIIAIIYEEDRKLPQRRADLYKHCVEVLLSKWDVRKRIKNRYPPDKKEFILRKIAFYGHSNNKRIMTEEEVISEMLRYFPQIGLGKEDAKLFLDEIWKRSYLLRQISMDSYDFLHLSFQEYFSALELKEGEDGISIAIQHLAEPWWEEPILLYAGTNKDASGLIKAIREKVPEDIFRSNLILFGKCIADAEYTELEVKKEVIDKLWSLYQTAEFRLLKEKALDVLARIKPDSIIDLLIGDLRDKEDSSVRRSAAEALGRIGSEKAVEPLLKALATDKDSDVQWRAAYALGRIGSEKAVEPLLKALATDKEAGVRRWAAGALGSIGSEKAVESLLKALATDKEAGVRGWAAGALGRIGSEKTVEPFLKALAIDKNSNVRERAAYALGRIGSEKAVEPLLKALIGDKEDKVRGWAAYALGSIGSEKTVEPLLKALSTDKEDRVRESAAYALGSIGSEKAVELLLKALATDKEAGVRGWAADALGRIGSEKTVEPLLKALATDKEARVRWRAADALGSIGSEKTVEPLLKALATDKGAGVRGRAADALGRIGSEKTVEPLLKALATDKEAGVRGSAADALGSIGSEKVIQGLKAALKDEGEYWRNKVKDAAFSSLEKISRRSKKRIGFPPARE